MDNAEAIVFREWTDMSAKCDVYNGDSRSGEFESVADIISRQITADLDIPIASGFPAGHGEANYPLLMGETVRLDVSEDSFTLEWIS